MTRPDDPAFQQMSPQWDHATSNFYYKIGEGLTKREYFAAMAMQAIASNPNYRRDASAHDVAEHAAQYADVLIYSLNKKMEVSK